MASALLDLFLTEEETSSAVGEAQPGFKHLLSLHAFAVTDVELCMPPKDPFKFVRSLTPYLKVSAGVSWWLAACEMRRLGSVWWKAGRTPLPGCAPAAPLPGSGAFDYGWCGLEGNTAGRSGSEWNGWVVKPAGHSWKLGNHPTTIHLLTPPRLPLPPPHNNSRPQGSGR